MCGKLVTGKLISENVAIGGKIFYCRTQTSMSTYFVLHNILLFFTTTLTTDWFSLYKILINPKMQFFNWKHTDFNVLILCLTWNLCTTFFYFIDWKKRDSLLNIQKGIQTVYVFKVTFWYAYVKIRSGSFNISV